MLPMGVLTSSEPCVIALGHAVRLAQRLYDMYWGLTRRDHEHQLDTAGYPLSALPGYYPGWFLGETAEKLKVGIEDFAKAAGIYFSEACRRVETTRMELAQAEAMISVLWEEYCENDHQDDELQAELHDLMDEYVRRALGVGLTIRQIESRMAIHSDDCQSPEIA